MNVKIVLRVMAIAFSFMAMPVIAATWYVPDDFATIQAAMDGASANDEVIVRDSTYTGADNKNLDFKGKALTLRSENGPESTIIDCEGDGRGFIFQWGETSATIVEGFSIINGGNVSEGGGIHILLGHPTITDCIISNNSASYGGGIFLKWTSDPYTIEDVTVTGNSATDGGGIYINEAYNLVIANSTISENTATVDGGGIYDKSNLHLRINNSTISGNSATAGNGGGIYNYSWDTVITGSTISANSSGQNGGGIYIEVSEETDIESSTISDNTAGWHGGGIYHNGNPYYDSYINNSIISGNTASSTGGGLYLFSTVRVINSVFTQNFADSGGGGICVNEPEDGTSNLLMTGSTISDNTSIGWGGGVLFYFASEGTITNSVISGNSSETGGGIYGYAVNSLTLIHATFSANSATSQGGALYWYSGSVNAINSIFWGGSASEGPEFALYATPVLDISYSDVEGGQAAIYDPWNNLNWGAGNIEADPLFVDPVNGDFHLKLFSPCIDAGTNDAPGLPDTDFDGDPRIMDGDLDGVAIVDMGADEVLSLGQGARLCPDGLGFGDVQVGSSRQMKLTLSNVKDSDIGIGSITDPAAPFSITETGCSGATLEPGDVCTITVRFSPASAGTFYDTLQIPTDDSEVGTLTIYLSGAGVPGGDAFLGGSSPSGMAPEVPDHKEPTRPRGIRGSSPHGD